MRKKLLISIVTILFLNYPLFFILKDNGIMEKQGCNELFFIINFMVMGGVFLIMYDIIKSKFALIAVIFGKIRRKDRHAWTKTAHLGKNNSY